MKKKRYIVLSPDGFTIEREKSHYKSLTEAIDAFLIWKERFRLQGYYSSNNGRIDLKDLEQNCTFEVV